MEWGFGCWKEQKRVKTVANRGLQRTAKGILATAAERARGCFNGCETIWTWKRFDVAFRASFLPDKAGGVAA
jgi:hypothetical protein